MFTKIITSKHIFKYKHEYEFKILNKMLKMLHKILIIK